MKTGAILTLSESKVAEYNEEWVKKRKAKLHKAQEKGLVELSTKPPPVQAFHLELGVSLPDQAEDVGEWSKEWGMIAMGKDFKWKTGPHQLWTTCLLGREFPYPGNSLFSIRKSNFSLAWQQWACSKPDWGLLDKRKLKIHRVFCVGLALCPRDFPTSPGGLHGLILGEEFGVVSRQSSLYAELTVKRPLGLAPLESVQSGIKALPESRQFSHLGEHAAMLKDPIRPSPYSGVFASGNLKSLNEGSLSRH
ncbi:multidrug resistance protein MdtB [Striga asiatica]|uniref:Multidrug resistance protein MdtB n=1 Tax=Striga asiatica TaxID=4170 RepID=A0A5A7PZ12_STRAF|nr:multidrug resistance protein MdtB [Striga asiatica]